YRGEESIKIERNLRITAGNAMLGTSLVTMELGMGATLVTGASIWANPLLFAESTVAGYAADKVVTNVTGSETLGTIASLAAGGLAGLGRVGAPTVAEALAANRARNATVVLLDDGTTLYRGIPRAALDAKVGTEAESAAVAIAATRSPEIAGGQLPRGSIAMTEIRALIGAGPIQPGGTIVNPEACETNCVPVARVTDQTLRGKFANRAAGEPRFAPSQPARVINPSYYKTKRSTA